MNRNSGSASHARVRRRSHASASLASGGTVDNSGSRRGNTRNGRWKRSHGTKFRGHVYRYIDRKGTNIARIKRMFVKLGNLRVVDAALFIGVAAKIGSILYSRRTPTSIRFQPTGYPSALSEPAPIDLGETASLKNTRDLPRWVRKWGEHKMPFHSPLLYRREDDDYSFGRDSYLDDDGEFHGERRTKVRFKGMLLKDLEHGLEHALEHHEEKLNSRGYAVVDDMLYNADHFRSGTQFALSYSEFEVNPASDEAEDFFSQHAFEFGDDDENEMHYINDDIYDHYYSFDDDHVRGTIGMGLDDEYEEKGGINDERDKCTMPTFYRTYYPTCNELHASLSGYQWLLGDEIYSRRWKKRKHYETHHVSKYLSHGYYRDAFLFRPAFVSGDEKNTPINQRDEVVFKTMRHMYFTENSQSDDDDINRRGLGFDPLDKYTTMNYREDMRKDAMVMELLSSSSRITDIYSHCAMSSVMEFAPTEIDEYIMPTYGYSPKRLMRKGMKNESEEPLNEYISPKEKLEIALEMAKCLAALHGFEDGVIAHVDLQVGQFLRGRDNIIKLVDFNRAEPLLYDTKGEKYCKWTNGQPADGNFRAPEEIVDAPLTEKIDVFSLGNVFYSVLTGRMVWEEYDIEDRDEKMAAGFTMHIPDVYKNSASTEKLVRAIQACWTLDVEERPSIFDVTDFLERAVEESKE